MVDKSNYQNFLTSINKNNKSFSKAERKLVVFFRKNSEQFANLNVSEIAEKANVSKATVSRFIRKLGYTDFTEFRYLLKAKSSLAHNIKKDTEDHELKIEFVFRIKNEYNFLIDRTINNIQPRDISYFVNHLTNASSIYIAGLGSSGSSAKEMSRKFIQIGFSFKVLDEISLILKYTHIMKQTDLFIVFSNHDESKYLLQAIKLAYNNRVHIILITNFAESALIKYANRIFLTSRENIIPNNVVIFPRLSQMFLIDILFNAVVVSDLEKYNIIIQRMSEPYHKYHDNYLQKSENCK